MSRIRFKKRRTLLLVAAALVVIGAVWWQTRGPREPSLKGKPLSWWFTKDLDRQNPQPFARLTAEELRGLGPKAVEWLAFEAARRSIWDMEEPSSARTPAAPFWRMRERWFHRPAYRATRIRFEAVVALGELGPDAASAVPSIIKAAACTDHDTRLVAAHALMRMGSTSWPAVADPMRHGDPRTREIFVYVLDSRWASDQQAVLSPVEFAEIVDLLTAIATADGDLRDLARRQLTKCAEAWKTHPRIAEGVRLVAEGLTRGGEEQRRESALFLSAFESRGTAAIPALTALAETKDQFTRVQILGTLAILDPDNPHWPKRLYELAASPNPSLAEAAEWALVRALK